MRQTLLLLILLLPAAAIVNSLIFGFELQGFARRVTRFASSSDIEEYKAVVKRQMYAALLQIVLLIAPPVLFVVGLFRNELMVSDVLFIIVPSMVVLAIGLLFKELEKKVRAIPAGDDVLARQRDEISNTWVKKPFPDW